MKLVTANGVTARVRYLSKYAVARAVKEVGGQRELARRVAAITGAKVTQQTVWSWMNRYEIPAEFAIPVSKATEGKVTRAELRPDIYPDE